MPHTQLTEMSEFVLKVRQIFFIPLAQGLYNHPSIGPPILDSETAHVISPTTNSKLLSWRGILFSPINYPPLLVRKCDINWTHRLLLLLMMRLLATTAATAAAVCPYPSPSIRGPCPAQREINFFTEPHHIPLYLHLYYCQDIQDSTAQHGTRVTQSVVE